MKRASILTLALISLAGNINAKNQTDNSLETTKIFKNNHNFAYQGNFPKIDGELLPDWEISKDVTYTLNKIKNEKSKLYGWDSNSINFKGTKAKSISTIVPIDVKSNVAISFEAKVKNPRNRTSGLVAELTVLDRNNKEKLKKTFNVLGSSTEWTTYNYISDTNVPDGSLKVLFKIKGGAEVEIQNLYVTEVENWSRTLNRKVKPKTKLAAVKNKTSGPRTMFNIMKNEKFVEMIWKARRPDTKNEKEFFIHYLQGALKLSDTETSKKYREKHISTSRLESMANKARKDLGLDPVSFHRPLLF